ncbi:aminopeptidase P family protein [Sphingobacterium tabacisoli]|uniref:Xaa-Pro aminopeptidase n=1 Tax=Sphingobacterium tabacisoli TaxID=2044855 RepID=A0ABW5L805_9SPHI|nr:aminopeptidase P family protein [Sphingobacterium tabacisoli]
MFSVQTYQSRRSALQKQISSGVLLFLGNIENPINFEHNTYPFRQDSTFLYYFGIPAPYLAAIIDIDNDKTIIFGNELSIDDIVWTGQQESLKDKSLKCGVQETLPFAQLASYLQQAKKSGRTIHYLPPYQSSNKLLLGELLQVSPKEINPSVPFIKAVVAQRSIKENQEIAEIEKALAVSTEMHLLAMRTAQVGTQERHMAAAIQHYAYDHNCNFAYPPIVTVHGEILHNAYQQNFLKEGDMILNDSGAETAMGYAADLTRTFPVSGRFTARQRDLYNVVLKAFEAARERLKPGIKFKDVHLLAARHLVEGLVAVGLMKGDPEEAVQAHAHTLFFQCGLGHMMGLDVHDMEDLGEQYVGYTEQEPKDTSTFGLKSLRLGRELQTGFVLTVEPGIYIIPELIDMWKKENKLSQFINYDLLESYRDFGGIRIEDNFLITNEGFRLLGPELIKSVEDIENYRTNHVQ